MTEFNEFADYAKFDESDFAPLETADESDVVLDEPAGTDDDRGAVVAQLFPNAPAPDQVSDPTLEDIASEVSVEADPEPDAEPSSDAPVAAAEPAEPVSEVPVSAEPQPLAESAADVDVAAPPAEGDAEAERPALNLVSDHDDIDAAGAPAGESAPAEPAITTAGIMTTESGTPTLVDPELNARIDEILGRYRSRMQELLGEIAA